ncbi:inositol monophosphatase [Patescibacteria group bacterium]|nr:inositol monophosphatase [Patescibacteria group bacterium]MCL5091896.1 inositol monophosphatase [Patescibacteria group bacterium]
MIKRDALMHLEMEAGRLLKGTGRYIYQSWKRFTSITTKLKDRRDVVTNVDVEAENRIREKLHKLWPEAGFIVEEGRSQEKEYNWVIDPIDGTKYFAAQTPIFVTQLALVRGREPVLGVIYNPVSQQLFSASLGNGARLNGGVVVQKTRTDPNSAILDWDGASSVRQPWTIPLYNALLQSFYRVRSIGGIYSIYVVTGAFDACVYLEEFVKTVDIKPNLIIMKEAGLTVKTLLVQSHPIVVCSNPTLIDHIEQIIAKL